MIKSYLNSAWRNLSRNKTATVINIAGLSLSLGIALIIFLIVRFELRFDSHYANADRIYRINLHTDQNGDVVSSAGSMLPLREALQNDLGHLLTATAVFKEDKTPLLIETTQNGQTHRSFYVEQQKAAYVDSNFTRLFGVEMIGGNSFAGLKQPYTLLLSRETAMRYFNTLDVAGKTILYQSKLPLTVAGVFEKPPANSNFAFDILISAGTMPDIANGMFADYSDWYSTFSNLQTFVLVDEALTKEGLDNKLGDFSAKYIDQQFGKKYLDSQPLRDLRYNTELPGFAGARSKDTITILVIIGVFLLIAAAFNYINLSTAAAVKRSREAGIRKVLGGTRSSIAGQFLLETYLLTAAAMIIALIFVEISIPFFESLSGTRIPFPFFSDPELQLFILGLAAVLGLLGAIYPAIALSKFSPVKALQNQLSRSYGSGLTLRRILVVGQFFISQTLIIATLIVLHQMQYMNTKDLGFVEDAIVYTVVPDNSEQSLRAFTTQLKAQGKITDYTVSLAPPSSELEFISMVSRTSETGKVNHSMQVLPVDEHFVSFYNIELLAGRDLRVTDSQQAVLLNESALQEFNFRSPVEAVGKSIHFWGTEAQVVGVLKDWHINTLAKPINAVVLARIPHMFYTVSAKLPPQSYPEAIASLRTAWEAVYGDHLFEYTFLDEMLGEYYLEEQNLAALLSTFAGIAVIIVALGLFGLISYLTAARTKEIGIRKVLGATVTNILFSISREFGMLLIVAIAFAIPLTWFVMEEWLSGFAYRISIGAELFLLAALVSLLSASATVGYKALRVARMNPVKSLRYE